MSGKVISDRKRFLLSRREVSEAYNRILHIEGDLAEAARQALMTANWALTRAAEGSKEN